MLTRKVRSGRIYKGLQRCVASYTILRYSIMKYENIVRAVFLNRPNRFIAEVDISGQREIVHVKNTGRCTASENRLRQIKRRCYYLPVRNLQKACRTTETRYRRSMDKRIVVVNAGPRKDGIRRKR